MAGVISRGCFTNCGWLNGRVRTFSCLSKTPVTSLQLNKRSYLRHVKLVAATQTHFYDQDKKPVQQCRVYGTGLPQEAKVSALTVIKNLKHLKYTPPPALVLGVAGLIPFAAAPAYMIVSGVFYTGIAYAQVAYGACILSFLGGVRWGMTMPENTLIQPNWFNIGYSVTPPLVAWLGMLFPTPLALLTLIGGLAGAAYMDTIMWGVPVWFKALRFVLSLGAILALWTTLMCRLTLNDETKPKLKAAKAVAAPAAKEVSQVKMTKVESPEDKPVDKQLPVSSDVQVDNSSMTQSKSSVPQQDLKEYTEED